MGGAPVKAAERMNWLFGDRLCIYTVLVGDDQAGEKLLKQVAKKGKCGFSARADGFTGKADMGDFVGKVFFTGMLDADGDGVADSADKCPNTPKGVQVDRNGCPFDSDGDGVYDYKDECPNTPKGIKVDGKGCPKDSDGDGIPDHADQCPNTPTGAKVDGTGCWEPASVYFDFDKSVIKSEYHPMLDSVAAIMKKNLDLKLKINGHTDNQGPKAYNRKLSVTRAESVVKHLIKSGIDRIRFALKGFWFSKPAASNDTPEGRAQNRRAEIIPVH
jgi:OOP family OmpA-OmpF porin